MKRRQFVNTVAILGLPFSRALAASGQPFLEESVLADCELIRFLGTENTGWLGRLYCARYPAEADVETLALPLRTALKAGADSFEDVIAKEFADGHIVHLDGWVLSRTEARQAALYSILYS